MCDPTETYTHRRNVHPRRLRIEDHDELVALLDRDPLDLIIREAEAHIHIMVLDIDLDALGSLEPRVVLAIVVESPDRDDHFRLVAPDDLDVDRVRRGHAVRQAVGAWLELPPPELSYDLVLDLGEPAQAHHCAHLPVDLFLFDVDILRDYGRKPGSEVSTSTENLHSVTQAYHISMLASAKSRHVVCDLLSFPQIIQDVCAVPELRVPRQ